MRAVLQRILLQSIALSLFLNRGIVILLGIAYSRRFSLYALSLFLNRGIVILLGIAYSRRFSLYGNNFMKSDEAKEMYERFLEKMKKEYVEDRIKGATLTFDDVFGAMMNVNIVNEVN
ncbi:hypothetical protein Glove_692g6 [Diversispora epigaea]|uniref:D-aminoacyl-tRNA deacylase n=1 Tax=Diversispora epigaea TaxID=1348612 RepID=A0A397G6Q5_9GLOM|nr:hypothetical protein Glove_692g6 [Diversispora epigaea]